MTLTTPEREARLAELTAFVQDFRAEAMRLAPAMHNGAFDFPKGACGWSCEILGPLLTDKGFGEWQLARAEARIPGVSSSRAQSHCWLEQDGIVIDPTADQFRELEYFQNKALPIVSSAPTTLTKLFRHPKREVAVAEDLNSMFTWIELELRSALFSD